MAYNGEILELGDIVPEVRPVAITRDGARVVLHGYADTPSCPGLVLAGFNAARKRLVDATNDPETDDGVAWAIFERDAISAVVQGIELGEAELLGGTVRGTRILEHLGWLKTSADALPESAGESPSITDESSPSLPLSMAESTG